MSLITDGISDALSDAFTSAGQKFVWNGNQYDCVLNGQQNELMTSKSLFSSNGYPEPGDMINVAGKRAQIDTIGNSTEMFVSGGINADNQFVDDPSLPQLLIRFNSLIGK